MPPVPVRDIGYAAESLHFRVADLDHAIALASAIVVTSGSWGTDGAERLVLEGRLRVLVANMARIRNALESVTRSIDVAESERTSGVLRAMVSMGPYVMSGIIGLVSGVRDARSGRIWADLRPVVSEILTAVREGPNIRPPKFPVRIGVHASYATSHPVTLADRVARIPSGDTHIRIERYADPAGNRFEVYLSGTDFFGDETKPWNFRSNLQLAVTGDSPSVEAVRRAMASAGITRDTPVVFTGHSQGGLIALALAHSGDYDVDAIVTVGCPVGAVPDSHDIPTIHLVHPEDPVPAAGGVIDPNSSTWVVTTAHGETLIDAHDKISYIPGIAALDALHDPEIDTLLNRIEPTGIGERRDYDATVSLSRRNSGMAGG